MNSIIRIFRDYYQTIVGMIVLYVVFLLLNHFIAPLFPLENQYKAKLMHFIIGLLFIWMFWYAIEQHQRAHLINPLWLLLGCIWGASGLFFVRWGLQLVGISVRDFLLYAAFPDWDLWIRGAHRNMLTHSAIVPIVLMVLAIGKKWKWLRDLSMGLAIGVASHLVWDVAEVANYPYNYIRHLDGFAGALWALGNAVLGVFVAYYLIGKSALPIEWHNDSIHDTIES
jgi:hypothetical protein